MKQRNTILILTIGVLVIAAVLGAGVYRNANAQVSTPAAPAAGTRATGDTGSAPAHPEFGRGPKGEYNNEQLATALGITVEELQAAYATALKASIDQGVTDGTITQEQADLMKGRYALFNSDGFQTAMQSAYETAVNQAVTDGVITQAQADLILADQAGAGFDGFNPSGFGMGGGRGGHHGGREGGAPGMPRLP